MAKPTYASMKLKVDTKPTKITFNDTEIEVLQYLPINDKYDLIMITLQNAYEEGIYNPLKNPAEIKIDEEATLARLATGAQPTDTVRSILSKAGIMEKFHQQKQGK